MWPPASTCVPCVVHTCMHAYRLPCLPAKPACDVTPGRACACALQAQARAHRLGQEKPVMIFRLVTRATVEERMIQVGAYRCL